MTHFPLMAENHPDFADYVDPTDDWSAILEYLTHV